MLGTGGLTHNSARSLALIASSLCFYLGVLIWVDSHQRMQKVLQVLLWSAIFTAGFAIVQTIVGGYTSLWLYLYPPDERLAAWDWRVTSFLNYPNTLAGYLNLILPFALACYTLGTGKWKKLGLWTAVLGFVALAMTQSRAGLVAFGCAFVCAVFLFTESWRKKFLLLGGFAIFVAGFYLVGRILSPARLGDIDVAEVLSRPILWVTAWNLFLRSPLCGIGLGNFTVLHGPYIQISWIPTDDLTVNNLYLEVLSETGIVGFIAFFGLVVVALQRGYRTFISATTSLERALGFGVFDAMITILVHGTLDLTLDVSPQFDTLFWIMLALLVASIRLQSRDLTAQSGFATLSADRT
jgi:O-antigen ligase